MSTLNSILELEGSEFEIVACCFLWDSKRNYLTYYLLSLFSLIKWGLLCSVLCYCVAALIVTYKEIHWIYSQLLRLRTMSYKISFLVCFLVTTGQEKISSNIWKGEGKQKLLFLESHSDQTRPLWSYFFLPLTYHIYILSFRGSSFQTSLWPSLCNPTLVARSPGLPRFNYNFNLSIHFSIFGRSS